MAKTQEFRLGDWRVRPDTHELLGAEETHQLKPRTMEVLVHLARHAGEVRTREEVLAAIWGEAFVGEEVLTHCVWELRQALGDGGRTKRYIRTIHRKGYQLIAPVAWIEEGDEPRTPLGMPAEGRDGTPPAAGGEAAEAQEAGEAPAVLRRWPPPELPARPYPVLLPYSHPALLAGRESEIAELRLRLRRPIPILGLSAPSGTGKSSLLLGGLVPELRADERGPPVALVRHPQEADLVRRLLSSLVEGGPPPPEDGDWAGFAQRLEQIEELAGAAPILVLDQFEEVLRPAATRARTVLGPLLAATVRRRPGTSAPPCRWLIAYRQDSLGELAVWLRDVLAEARAAGVAGIEALPHDLGDAQRFHTMTLLPLATPVGGGDALAEAGRIFEQAISKPLAIPSADGGRRYPWHFAPGHAERLARAFAEARLEQPDAPLGPELQVTLGHLLDQAGADGRIEVGDDVSHLLDRALEDHLRRALAAAFPGADRPTAVRRARALLALRELADAPVGDGLPVTDLARAIGEDGGRVLTELSTPRARLVVFRDAPEGMRCALSHVRLAPAIVRLVEEEGRRGELLVDADLLALRHFVELKVAHHRSRDRQATRMPRRHFRRLAAHAEALLVDEERRAWWGACRKRRRADRLRAAVGAAAALAVLLGVVWVASLGAARSQRRQEVLDRVVHGDPPAALQALDQLASQGVGAAELSALLRRRDDPWDVLESSPRGLDGDAGARWLLGFVESVLPWVEDTPEDPVLVANLVWRLDFLETKDTRLMAEARALRERVLEPLRRKHPPPGEPETVAVPAGEVRLMRYWLADVAVDACRMQRSEVTEAEMRRLWPGSSSALGAGEDDLPAWNTWFEAYTYAAWLGGRLPTEAEWVHAARAGCAFAYCREDGREATLDEVAWWAGNSREGGTGVPQRQPVMRKAPNPWGLYDIVGNHREWTAEHTGSDLPRDRGIRIQRGSDVASSAGESNAEQRIYRPGHLSGGFRVVYPNPNIPPAVALKSPPLGSTLPSGRDIPLVADAFDVDGSLAGVRFSVFQRGSAPEILGETASAPHAVTWTPAGDGCYILRLEAVDDAGGTAAADAEVTVGSCPQQPHGDRPAAIPGRIEAEDFDLGSNGDAYFDATPGNTGGGYRSDTSVDIELCEDSEGGWNVGWIEPGEWLEYTVEVAAAGSYELAVRVASMMTGGAFHVEFDGADKTGPMIVPVTGGWQAWETVSTTVDLDAGVQMMRWRSSSETGTAYNVNYFSLTVSGSD